MPPPEYPESGQPHSIVHGLDYMERDGGGYEFYYNYLDYLWAIDGTEIRARHYLDKSEPGTVAVMVPLAEFDQPKYAGILAYLQRRYVVIETFEDKGIYAARWISAGYSRKAEIAKAAEEVRSVILEYWDPLDLKDSFEGDRCYKQYYWPLAAMIVSGNPVSKLAEYLLSAESVDMNLPADRERVDAVANRLWEIGRR